MEKIDLSKQRLKTIALWTHQTSPDQVKSLILDENEFSNLESLAIFKNLQQLSAVKNHIKRMSSLMSLVNLSFLDLSNNSVVCVEGLKSLKLLKHLNLSGNFIKNFDNLSNNIALEYLNLSGNAILHISDVSYMKQLKELHLHNNQIAHLLHSDRYLPTSLETLTLDGNRISDLTEIAYLEKLTCLKQITLKNNPCLEKQKNRNQVFNYKPYLKMWCLELSIVDGSPLDPLESLRAEWLYSQGRGRRFRPGDHEGLVSFLNSTCPMSPKTPSAAEDRKLLLILSKSEQYKQQLRDQSGEGDGSPRMAISYHDAVTRHSARASPEVMSRSLDCSVLRYSPSSACPSSQNIPARSSTPLQAASTLVPVPESLVSPDVIRPLHPLMQQPVDRSTRSPLATPSTNTSPRSTPKSTPTKIAVRKSRAVERDMENTNGMTPRNLQNIQLRASQKRQKQVQIRSNSDIGIEKKAKVSPIKRKATALKTAEVVNDRQSHENVTESVMWRAAVAIQRRWRGYRARVRDPRVTDVCRTIQTSRIQDYIMKVAEDMEATKTALEGNRKLQVLQMKAIDAVWRKLDGSDVENLATSCLNLSKQIEELRTLVQALQTHGANANANDAKPAAPVATQTDIVAVRTPHGDAAFPAPSIRPNALHIDGPHGATLIHNVSGKIDTTEPVCLTPACQEGKNLLLASPTLSLD